MIGQDQMFCFVRTYFIRTCFLTLLNPVIYKAATTQICEWPKKAPTERYNFNIKLNLAMPNENK